MADDEPSGEPLLVDLPSGVTHWTFFEHDGVYSKVGGDLIDYDQAAKTQALRDLIPVPVNEARLRLFVTSEREPAHIDACADNIVDAAKRFGFLLSEENGEQERV